MKRSSICSAMMCRVQPGTVAAKIDIPPLGMAGRNQKLIPIGEKPLGETLDASVSITSFPPVEHRKNRRDCNRIDRLSIRNKRRIVFRLELTQSIVVCECLCEWDRDQVKSEFGGILVKKSTGFPTTRTSAATSPDRSFCSAVCWSIRPALPAPRGAGKRSSLSDLIRFPPVRNSPSCRAGLPANEYPSLPRYVIRQSGDAVCSEPYAVSSVSCALS